MCEILCQVSPSTKQTKQNEYYNYRGGRSYQRQAVLTGRTKVATVLRRLQTRSRQLP